MEFYLVQRLTPAEKPNQAEVIALGKGEKLEGIKVGDKVIFNRFSGNEIEDGEEKIFSSECWRYFSSYRIIGGKANGKNYKF